MEEGILAMGPLNVDKIGDEAPLVIVTALMLPPSPVDTKPRYEMASTSIHLLK